MFQTSVVLSLMLEETGLDRLVCVGQEVELTTWHQQVLRIRQLPACDRLFQGEPESFGAMVAQQFQTGRVAWRLAAESSAAGFPSLLELLIPPENARKTQDHWVKLLVVDVGAGSTDAGYFISSRRVNGELLLHYLKPAATFDYAGEQLTEMLRDFYLREKYREISIQEAETLKLSAPDQWKNQQFVRDWRGRIARAVGEYMFHVPDELRLGETAIPGLNVVMTGGSGLVEELGEAVRDEVVESLSRRGVAGNVSTRTRVVAFPNNLGIDPIDWARRAVSIGAGTSNFARLSYCEQLAPPVRARGALETWRG
jgi:hypothetical protein